MLLHAVAQFETGKTFSTMLGVVASVSTQPKLPIKLDIMLLSVSWISVFEAINSVIHVLDD